MKTDLRHSDNNQRILHKDLVEGDLIWVQGELFKVTNIFSYPDDKGRYSSVIRYTGVAVDGYNSYKGTTFDNSIYGAGAEVDCTIVKRAK